MTDFSKMTMEEILAAEQNLRNRQKQLDKDTKGLFAAKPLAKCRLWLENAEHPFPAPIDVTDYLLLTEEVKNELNVILPKAKGDQYYIVRMKGHSVWVRPHYAKGSDPHENENPKPDETIITSVEVVKMRIAFLTKYIEQENAKDNQ